MAAYRHSSLQSDSLSHRHTDGARRIIRDGFAKLSASMHTKARGTRSATSTAYRRTAAGCNSYFRRGARRAGLRGAWTISPLVRRVNSYTGRGSSGSATGTRGENGAPRERAALAELAAWPRCNDGTYLRLGDAWALRVMWDCYSDDGGATWHDRATGRYRGTARDLDDAWDRANREALR